MVDLGLLGATFIYAVSALLSLAVLGYRWERTLWIRSWTDRAIQRLTGRPDLSWLRLWHVVAGLSVIAGVNVLWHLSVSTCTNDDAWALLASGEAALHGGNPLEVTFCGSPNTPLPIPYGLAEVGMNAVGALSGSIVGIWVVWTLVALAIVPLVWTLGGEDRRYLTLLVASSVLYLPNLSSNIGLSNAVVPLSVLLAAWGVRSCGKVGPSLRGIGVVLASARFPAIFPILGCASSGGTRERWWNAALAGGGFLGATLVSYGLWGSNAIDLVFFHQFSRLPPDSLNIFALLLRAEFAAPGPLLTALQAVGVLGLVALVNLRRYSLWAAIGLPALGVISLSQYVTFHFLLWLLPAVLLGGRASRWVTLYGALAYLDDAYLLEVLANGQGVWWPYEAMGVVLALLLVATIVVVVLDEERRLRARRGEGSRDARPSQQR